MRTHSALQACRFALTSLHEKALEDAKGHEPADSTGRQQPQQQAPSEQQQQQPCDLQGSLSSPCPRGPPAPTLVSEFVLTSPQQGIDGSPVLLPGMSSSPSASLALSFPLFSSVNPLYQHHDKRLILVSAHSHNSHKVDVPHMASACLGSN